MKPVEKTEMHCTWTALRLGVVIALLFSWAATPARAQQQTGSRIGIAWGALHLKHQDLIHSPFVHGGMAPTSVALQYERSGRRVHMARVAYSTVTSRLTAPYPIQMGGHEHATLPHRYHLLEATYQWGLRLNWPASDRHSAAVGAAVRLDLQATDYNYGVENNFGYFMGPSLNAWYGHSLALYDGTRLAARVLTPLLSWVARSPYLVNDDRFIENISSNSPAATVLAFLADGRLAGFDQLQRIDFALELERVLHGRFALGTAYRLEWLRMPEPRTLTSVRNSIELTTTIRM
jgi:hypothetical protein